MDGSHVWISVSLAIVSVEKFTEGPEMQYQLWATRGGENIGGQMPSLLALWLLLSPKSFQYAPLQQPVHLSLEPRLQGQIRRGTPRSTWTTRSMQSEFYV